MKTDITYCSNYDDSRMCKTCSRNLSKYISNEETTISTSPLNEYKEHCKFFKQSEEVKIIEIEDLGMQYLTEKSKRKTRVKRLKCLDCGETFTRTADSIRLSLSQGGRIVCNNCSKTLTSTIEYSPLRKRWNNMKSRCYNKNNKSYKNYGAVGVTVCKLWRTSFKAFEEWALNNGFKEHLTLDKDILSDELGIYPHVYSPETCKWIPKEDNISYSSEKPVIKLDLEGNILQTYTSIAKAAKMTGCSSTGIGAVCNNKRSTCGGFKWKFA